MKHKKPIIWGPKQLAVYLGVGIAGLVGTSLLQSREVLNVFEKDTLNVILPRIENSSNVSNVGNSSNTDLESILGSIKISQKGIELIKSAEGFRDTPYDDFGVMAIGYGHTIKDEEDLTRVTREQAEKLLYNDIAHIKRVIADNVEVPLNQNQYDAVSSFSYNIGEGAFENSTMLSKLNLKDYSGASGEFKRWVYIYNEDGSKTLLKGLVRRRKAEAELFNGDK